MISTCSHLLPFHGRNKKNKMEGGAVDDMIKQSQEDAVAASTRTNTFGGQLPIILAKIHSASENGSWEIDVKRPRQDVISALSPHYSIRPYSIGDVKRVVIAWME